MISLANTHDKSAVREMWSICFGDSEEFMELYFSEKYKAENTLIFFDDDTPVASLQMLPYQFSFYGTELPAAYISGACTLPQYRSRGYMTKLLLRAFEMMRERNIPLSLLIPAEDWLYGYYSKLGYEKVFEKNDTPIELQKIVDTAKADFNIAYEKFDQLFRNKDFCVQKTKSDFITLVKSAEMDHFPKLCNLSGMARVIDAEQLLVHYAKQNAEKSFSFLLEDQLMEGNAALYKVSAGGVERLERNISSAPRIDLNSFTRFIFGFSSNHLPIELKKYFSAQKTIMNLMLE